MAEITIPAKYDTPEKKWAYCKRAKRVFIDEVHNVLGKWCREGLTKAEYDTLPSKMKDRMPYQLSHTLEEWAAISDELEKDLEIRIMAPLSRIAKEIEYSKIYDADIDKEDLVS